MNLISNNENLVKLKKIIEENENFNKLIIKSLDKTIPIDIVDNEKIIEKLKSMKKENEELKIKNFDLEQKIQENSKIIKKIHEEHEEEKQKYESTISRNLSLIEELLKDKQILNENFERLLIEKKEIEKKSQELTSFYKEKIKNDLKLQKENLENMEKQNRKKWFFF